MSPRPRSVGNKDLRGTNLYPKVVKGVTYYQYRDPRNGKFHGMGTDKETAVRDAKALNAAIYAELVNRRVDSVVKSRKSPTVTEGILIYWRIIERNRTLKPNTRRTRSYILSVIADRIGKLKIDAVTVLDCAAVLNSYTDQDKARMAQSVRSVMIDLFKVLISEGIRDDNPAEKTLAPRVVVTRSRLTIEDFWAIHAKAETWLQNAMLIGLVTGQRREDIAGMKFRDVKDGYLEVIQGKTGTAIKIGLNLALEGRTLESVISQCRDMVTQNIIHHTITRTMNKRGDSVHKDTISRGFKRALVASGLTWTKKPPTFHEIRSLSGRMHDANGISAKDLLGHTDQRMTDVYLNVRGREWVVVG